MRTSTAAPLFFAQQLRPAGNKIQEIITSRDVRRRGELLGDPRQTRVGLRLERTRSGSACRRENCSKTASGNRIPQTLPHRTRKIAKLMCDASSPESIMMPERLLLTPQRRHRVFAKSTRNCPGYCAWHNVTRIHRDTCRTSSPCRGDRARWKVLDKRPGLSVSPLYEVKKHECMRAGRNHLPLDIDTKHPSTPPGSTHAINNILERTLGETLEFNCA